MVELCYYLLAKTKIDAVSHGLDDKKKEKKNASLEWFHPQSVLLSACSKTVLIHMHYS